MFSHLSPVSSFSGSVLRFLFFFFFCKVVQVLAIGLLSPELGRTSYLEQDDHGEEHVEAPKGKGKVVALGIWHVKGRVFCEGSIPEAVT